MKKLIYILTAALLLAFTSCSRKVVLHKSHASTNKDSSHVAIDTTKKSTTEQSSSTTKYGDTLKANLFVQKPTEDTSKALNAPTPFKIESNGIKVQGNIKPSNKGFDIDFTAIAKPTETTSTTLKTTTEQKGVTEKSSTNTKIEHQEKGKIVEKEDELVKGVVIIGISLFGLILVVAWLYFEHRLKPVNNG